MFGKNRLNPNSSLKKFLPKMRFWGTRLTVFYLCLGYQFIAEVLAGSVDKSDSPEISVCDVKLTKARTSRIFM